MKRFLFLIAGIILLAGCNIFNQPFSNQNQNKSIISNSNSAIINTNTNNTIFNDNQNSPLRDKNENTNSMVGLPNPASKYCVDQGNRLEIRNEEAGQIGICILPDGRECEEWKYFRGECTQKTNSNEITNSPATGTIEGSLSYPSEGIPEDMRICAVNVTTKEETCTQDHIIDSEYTYGAGYKLNLKPGDYNIYAATDNLKDYKSFYSEFVTCGQTPDCNSHAPILVTVQAGELIKNIDPIDWYNL